MRFGYAKFYSRSHNAVIRVYDEAGNVIETHEHAGDFKEWQRDQNVCDYRVSAAHLSTARINSI